MDRLVSFPCLEPQEALPTIVFVCNIEDAETFAVLLLFGCETLSVLLLFGWYIDLSTERLSLFFYFLVQESCSKIPGLSLFNVLLRVGW